LNTFSREKPGLQDGPNAAFRLIRRTIVKDKATIRYIGFRPGRDGGRLFDFCVSAAEHQNLLTTFEIPLRLLSGDGRIRLQEGVGICYAKLKHLLEVGAFGDIPAALCLTGSDLDQYREVVPGNAKRNTTPHWR
jgi:hypothetical protein